MARRVISICIVLLILALNSKGKHYCTRLDQCWPTDEEIKNLSDSLNPELNRTLIWNTGEPRISAVPIYSEQPLYGSGRDMAPVYSSTTWIDGPGLCFRWNWSSEFCQLSVRNSPYEDWAPGFIVWPITAKHVQIAVQFAIQHGLCIMVAGSGHDLLNRHSCQDGFFIRTSLMKQIVWDLNDQKQFSHLMGNVRLGPGIVFSEIHQSASEKNRLICTGWPTTVGIVGFSLGGGFGPFAASNGLGVDNILEVEIVNAKGELVTANENQNPDLFWALRGGGGSTWGVVTAITIQAHQIPEDGITQTDFFFEGNMCRSGTQQLEKIIQVFLKNSLTLQQRWGGISYFIPMLSGQHDCGANWTAIIMNVYTGSDQSSEFQKVFETFKSIGNSTTIKKRTYVDWNQKIENQTVQKIEPFSVFSPEQDYVGGIPSVLLSRQIVESGKVKDYLLKALLLCKTDRKCLKHEFYFLTGNLGSQQDPNVSISDGLRQSLFHLTGGNMNQTDLLNLYKLGNYSYFSESAYQKFDDWKYRYWGENNAKLEVIKSQYDPDEVFWCSFCVEKNLQKN